MQRNKRADNVVLSQWRQPVETQNLASPEGICAIYTCDNHYVVTVSVACETQDFASLLYMPRFLYMRPLRLHSMKNRMPRRASGITVRDIPSSPFPINACYKTNNANLTILLC